ncbi:ABC transporter ATP-binding protein [Williamsia muralis]|nr:ABC transporter ATP-binding protein [Williamsia marianensis]
MTQKTAPVVEVTNLIKTFRRRDGVVVSAVDDVSLAVHPGEFVVLLGPSGCGKTTLLRCIAGLEHPDSGTVSVHGKVQFGNEGKVRVSAEGRRLSMVFQSYALWPHMTVSDNVAFPLKNRKIGKSEIQRRVGGALEKVGVDSLAKSYPSQISGGQQQRVALARALVSNDGLILFDEPLSNVDARVRDELRFEILEMQREIGFAALYVTHDQTEAMAMADQIAVLGGGKVRQLGSPDEIYLRPTSAYVAKFVGTANELAGTVVEVDADGRLSVNTHLGKVSAVSGDGLCAAGDDVVLVWRPEDAQVVTGERSDEAANVWTGRILASVFVGAHIEADVSFGDVKQRLWSMTGGFPSAGSTISIFVPPRSVRAFRP